MNLKAELRTAVGTRAAGVVRSSGRLPAIIYGHGEPPQAVSLPGHEIVTALARGVRMLKVDVGGKTDPYLIKAVQYDHLDDQPIHLDLARVDLNERVTVRIGIELRGVAKGIADGGALDQYLGDLQVECLVMEIPGTLHPMVTDLGIGDSLFVKDLVLPDGVVAMANPEDRVASVRAVLDEVEPETETDETGGGGEAEPERIGRVRKDEEDDKKKA